MLNTGHLPLEILVTKLTRQPVTLDLFSGMDMITKELILTEHVGDTQWLPKFTRGHYMCMS